MERKDLAKLILERAEQYFDRVSYRVDVDFDRHGLIDKVVLTISCEGYYVQHDFIVEVLNYIGGDKNEYIELAFEEMLITLAKGVFRKRD